MPGYVKGFPVCFWWPESTVLFSSAHLLEISHSRIESESLLAPKTLDVSDHIIVELSLRPDSVRVERNDFAFRVVPGI